MLIAHLPALETLWLDDCELQDNHADAVMSHSWKELHTSDDMDPRSLARLPLRHIKRLCVPGLTSTNVTASPADELAAALDAAPGCCVASGPGGTLRLNCPANQLPDLLQLLARWDSKGLKQLEVSQRSDVVGDGADEGMNQEQLTPAAVHALGALLEGLPECRQLNICKFLPHPAALLLPALARSSVRVITLSYDRLTEGDLLLLCAGGQASSPVEVRLERPSTFMGDMAHVCAILALAESGVEFVPPVNNDAED
jgi:hypothetical protein